METVRKRLLAATLYDPQGTLQRISPQPHHRMAAIDPAYPCQKTAALSVLHRQIQIIYLTENMKTIPTPSTIEGISLDVSKLKVPIYLSGGIRKPDYAYLTTI